ncbi:MAG: hypothetical protein KF816_15480 [Melioribacteraceae bacterium]|jgi:LAS superfamily LD-carboxypeptidase LdcB|nr:hypothetical protein [Melioribacteraceae bacterium]
MRKKIYILISIIYLFSTIGVQFAYHFCGDYVFDVSLYASNLNEEPEGCCEDQCDDSCCTTDTKQIKVSDEQQPVVKFEEQELTVVAELVSTDTNFSNSLASLNNELLDFYSPPPNKLNILYCTYLI